MERSAARPTEDYRFMRLAITRALDGVEAGQSPFGACIVKDGEVIACEHNTVWASTDITAHAEVHAIRRACRALEDIDLSGCTIYSTTEPCPMCFSAVHWARIDRIVFGTRIADARAAGFRELGISNSVMKLIGESPVEVVEDFLRDECLALFETFLARPNRVVY